MTDMEKLTSQTRRYIDLQIDALKLKTIDGLSVGVSSLLAMMAILMAGAIALAAISFGLVILLGELIGSWAGAAFIIGGVFLVILILLYIFRKKLFLDMFVQLFTGIFYGKE
ncbi:MAG: hypothetical protein J5976_02950 [Bacteroidales bacterium]|nr:hypothetical protein [Bacteroidales bacterium]